MCSLPASDHDRDVRFRLPDPVLNSERHVSPKTLDYINTLSRISTGAAIDVRAHQE